MRIHKETMNRHKLNLLTQAADEVMLEGENIIDIKIFSGNINSYNNWQKLRYHGLITKIDGERGKWLITTRGWQFLRGEIYIPKYVLIGDNRIIERSKELIDARQLYKEEEIVQQTFEYYEPTYKELSFSQVAIWDEVR